MGDLTSAVADLIRQTAREVVLPLFGTAAADPQQKRPDDWVTAADMASEEMLGRLLPPLFPGSIVVGEEAVHADPAVMQRLAGDAVVWVIDPVDGTRNYAAGREPFAMIVALVQDGVTNRGWIYLPTTEFLLSTELGSGTAIADERIHAPANRSPLRGVVPLPVLQAEVADDVTARAADGFELLPSAMCSGYEYHQLLRGDADFAVFATSLPWDHAAGALATHEAGGLAAYFDGEPYTVRDEERRSLLVARTPEIWESARDRLLPALAADPDAAWTRR